MRWMRRTPARPSGARTIIASAAEGDEEHAEDDQRRAQPLGATKRLAEKDVGGDDLGRDESEPDADRVGKAQRRVADDPGEGDLRPQTEEPADDLPEDEE